MTAFTSYELWHAVGTLSGGAFAAWTLWAILSLQRKQRKTDWGLERTARLIVRLHALDLDAVERLLADAAQETP